MLLVDLTGGITKMFCFSLRKPGRYTLSCWAVLTGRGVVFVFQCSCGSVRCSQCLLTSHPGPPHCAWTVSVRDGSKLVIFYIVAQLIYKVVKRGHRGHRGQACSEHSRDWWVGTCPLEVVHSGAEDYAHHCRQSDRGWSKLHSDSVCVGVATHLVKLHVSSLNVTPECLPRAILAFLTSCLMDTLPV